ncbi:helix-turn-helix transcriptional regulator [Caulobacter endophyticus]|uniref:Transcriptional regulator n=1 Tax=Caulobacter endophyticus TaxID=2172652 RepID=A0A2T9KCV0_9CAUL|nr:transcriptional regulator [Caulobacter endophyticus]
MIGNALRLLRRFKGFTQTEMAQRLGVAKSWISAIEGGKKDPTLSLLQSYALVLDVPLSSILFFSEQIDVSKPSERARSFVSKKVLAILDFIDAQSGEEADGDVAPNASDKAVSASQAGPPQAPRQSP